MADPVDLPYISVIPVDIDEEALKLGGEYIPEPLDYPNFKIPQTYSCDKKLS